ncbi:sulfatase-like hydrolase/transferase [Rhodopirellula sp. P2]|uniref:sulfatase-like hydrolase/transferase n=1 Tax=Rhodopirellula sp. P2 TaxID=2127060 RepID=UPI002368B90D|nr:sulfatase-like hydrolase/transferase [Rhodopirellula sp. P2]WDQ15064.1 sulfatase-like hydrolase/transferase [Rhodopirellula sp. P2]
MRSRYLLCLLVGLMVLSNGFAPAPVTADTPPSQPNILFVLYDDLGWGDLGCYYQNESKHDRTHQTPHWDAMAAEGLQMRNHYCPAPVCAPSRASLLTGVHQGHAAVRDNQFDKALPDVPTVASVLKDAGYTTALIGKYGLQGDGNNAQSWPAYPTKRGFDEFFGYVRHRDGHNHYPADKWPLANSEAHANPVELWHNDDEISSQLKGCYTADLFTAKTKQFLVDHQSQSADEPFFVFLSYDTPHASIQYPASPYPEGQGVNGGVQWLGETDRMINTVGTIDTYKHPDYANQGWTDAEVRFATSVRRLDDLMGDLLQTLRDLKMDENTLVVLSSDNGPHSESYLRDVNYKPTSFQSYGPFDGMKRDCYEGGIRVPTIAWWPGKISPGVDRNPSQFHDWLTTFADLAGATIPARADGVSLAPTLLKNGEQAAPTTYVEYFNGGKTPDYNDFEPARRGARRGQMQAIFLEGYKGVRHNIQSHSDPFQIYDVANDPGEANNLAGTSAEMDALQQRMHDRVLQVRSINASAPRPYDQAPIPADDSLDADAPMAVSYSPTETAVVSRLNASDSTVVDIQKLDVDEALRTAGKGNVRVQSVLNVAKTGRYELRLTATGDAVLRLHDAALIDTTGQSKTEASVEVILEAGTHPVDMIVRLAGNDSVPALELNELPDAPQKSRQPAKKKRNSK